MTAHDTGLTAADAEYARQHAADYASAGGRQPERGEAYAAWYAAAYLPGAETLDDLPAHTTAYGLFLDAQAAAADAEPEATAS